MKLAERRAYRYISDNIEGITLHPLLQVQGSSRPTSICQQLAPNITELGQLFHLS